MFSIYVLIALFQIGTIFSSPIELDLNMPDVSPKYKDSYLCRKFKLDENQPIYITEFEANSTKEIAHHILLYACDQANTEDVWNCGEMNRGHKGDQYKLGSVCAGSKQSIIYAWALDAPKLVLPNDVAFKLGGDTDKKYLVMQVHYANVDSFINGGTDRSGLKLKGQTEPVSNSAAVYLLETGGYIESQKQEYFESACEMQEEVVLHPFAFRTHAHKLGIINSGYVVKKDKSTGKQQWTEIGRRSPQLPQMFFPAVQKVEVNKGDVLVARCTMKNFRDHTVYIGATGDDEMCNFYVMYYVKGDKVLNNNICLNYGPPYWRWKDFKDSKGNRLDLSKIPADASILPEEQEMQLDMESDHGMHGMHGMDHSTEKTLSEEKMSEASGESAELKELLKEKNLNYKLKTNLIESMLNENEKGSVEISEESHRGDVDEFESYLKQLENEYYLRKLLKKFNLN